MCSLAMFTVLLIGVHGQAALATRSLSADRPAWQWTTTERIQMRTSPAVIERLRVKPDAVRERSMALRPSVLRIEGRTHAQLLLPSEVFRNLLSGLSGPPEGAAVLREAYAPIVRRLGLPEDLLDQLRELSSDYLQRSARIRAINERLGRGEARAGVLRSERDSLAVVQCSALVDALNAARTRYGAIAFDRFLYEAVAPGMVVTLAEPDPAADLARMEGGCR